MSVDSRSLSRQSRHSWIEQLEAFLVSPSSLGLVKITAEMSQRHRISYCDGAIVAAAELSVHPFLYTEDRAKPTLIGLNSFRLVYFPPAENFDGNCAMIPLLSVSATISMWVMASS